jgi:hypothetical protein
VSRGTCNARRHGTNVRGSGASRGGIYGFDQAKEVTLMKIKVRKNSTYLGTLLG